MNDTIDTDKQESGGLKGSFGDRGINMNAMGYGHPHAEKILREATEIIAESETGQLLLVMLRKKLVPVQVMKGRGESGFSPDMGTIIMQIPSNIDKALPEHVIHLIKALDEAAQERAGFTAPNPREDLMAYASFIHGRNLDSIMETCKIVKELTNSSYYSVLLDSLKDLGLNTVYEGYIKGLSRDELYTLYAEAYETI